MYLLELELDLLELEPYLLDLYLLELPDGTDVAAGIWSVTTLSLDRRREELGRRLDDARPSTDALRDALEVARTRLSLLTDRTSSRRTISMPRPVM